MLFYVEKATKRNANVKVIYIPEQDDHGVVDALKHVAFTVDNVTINFNLQNVSIIMVVNVNAQNTHHRL